MTITLAESIEKSKEYAIHLEKIQDCWLKENTVVGSFANTEPISSGDIVFNELLFNPYTNGEDFIEIYNRSNKWLNLKDLHFYSLEKGVLSNPQTVSSNLICKPNQTIFFTPSMEKQIAFYPETEPSNGYVMLLPSLNNDSGTVIMKLDTMLLDKFSYLESIHNPLISDKNGKSVEKLNPLVSSNSKSNWYTTAETSHFATPGIQNSHCIQTDSNAGIFLSSSIISPDNDGQEDFLVLKFNSLTTENLTTISIYSILGNEIFRLVNNQLVANHSEFSWDGFDEKKQKIPVGIYVLCIQSTELQTGNVLLHKFPIVVAEKL